MSKVLGRILGRDLSIDAVSKAFGGFCYIVVDCDGRILDVVDCEDACI